MTEAFVPRGIRVEPLSRAKIRGIAEYVRTTLGVGVPVDMVKLIEHVLPHYGVEFEVLHAAQMKDDEALTYPDDLRMVFREDVYAHLLNCDPRANFTAAHEVGHLMLHQGVGLARSNSRQPHAAFRDSEWQADAFAAELLMPVSTCRGADIWTLAARCRVSRAAARIRLRSLK